MSAVASETGKQAFMYWVKETIPDVYEEGLTFSEQLTRVNNYMQGLYNDLHTATYNFTQMGLAFENMMNYLNAFSLPPVEGESEEDFNPHTVEGFRDSFINKNIQSTSDLNNLFFALWS